MAYYTEDDRKRAAAARRRNQQFRQLLKSPEDSFDILGVKVPKVTVEPQLADYDLTDDIKERLAQADKDSIAQKKSTRLLIFWLALALPTIVSVFYLGFWNGIGLVILGGFYIYIPLLIWANDPKPYKTHLHTQLDNYELQKRYYEYWIRKKDKNYWDKMSGHAFESAVANLFRPIGYYAEVSKIGGDGGVDIVLEKGNRKIAVQCKRYKGSVGPHVIRDLWGTMHHLGYNEGCIVTTTGFTKGVIDFANENGIFLIDLNDILKATSENGDFYLAKKIGE